MIKKLLPVLLASAVAGCMTPGAPLASRGVESVNQPVLNRSTFTIDVGAPGGVLSPSESARLDGWFRGLDLGYGDSIYVDAAGADAARYEVAQVAGNYGMLIQAGVPVTAGMVNPGSVRVVVSRARAEVPGCPNWSRASQPNFNNRTSPNFGCGVNSALAQMVANPEDLVHGREGTTIVDPATGTKAVQYYRSQAPTGTKGLQEVTTKGSK
jgi:pilus assembly protein CpaD